MSVQSEVRPQLPESGAVPVDDDELGALTEFAVHLAEAAGTRLDCYVY